MICSSPVFGQTYVSVRGSMLLNEGSYFSGAGLGVQKGLNSHMLFGGNVDVLFGNGATIYSIEPRLNYYIDEKLKGFHLGTNIAYTKFSGGASGFLLGGMGGYTLLINDKLFFDAGLGVGFFTGDLKGIAFKPALSLGYTF